MKTKKLTALSLLTSLALIIFIIEAQLPPLAPIPGIKLGLANIITLVTLVWFGKKEAFAVLMLRVTLGSIFAGTVMSFLYSTAGGISCFIAMTAAQRLLPDDKLWVVSVFGALAHNTGQIAVAIAVTRTVQIAAYLPLLAVSAVITGIFTGIAAMLVVRRRVFNNWRER